MESSEVEICYHISRDEETNFQGEFRIVVNARVPRRVVSEHREDLLIGAGCYNSEAFEISWHDPDYLG